MLICEWSVCLQSHNGKHEEEANTHQSQPKQLLKVLDQCLVDTLQHFNFGEEIEKVHGVVKWTDKQTEQADHEVHDHRYLFVEYFSVVAEVKCSKFNLRPVAIIVVVLLVGLFETSSQLFGIQSRKAVESSTDELSNLQEYQVFEALLLVLDPCFDLHVGIQDEEDVDDGRYDGWSSAKGHEESNKRHLRTEVVPVHHIKLELFDALQQ